MPHAKAAGAILRTLLAARINELTPEAALDFDIATAPDRE
jgi:hypothetical protein